MMITPFTIIIVIGFMSIIHLFIVIIIIITIIIMTLLPTLWLLHHYYHNHQISILFNIQRRKKSLNLSFTIASPPPPHLPLQCHPCWTLTHSASYLIHIITIRLWIQVFAYNKKAVIDQCICKKYMCGMCMYV